MMYNEQFVLCVLHNGSPVREIDRAVSLPYHSEYKIRLKNKNFSLRARAKVWIDGREVSNIGDFILNPGETVDLERVLDHSLTKGKKFKFVPLTDGRVNDPTDPENGIIKVEFYRERYETVRPLKKSIVPRNPNYGSDGGGKWFTYPTHTNTEEFTSGPILGSSNISSNCNYVHDSYTPVECGAGATVEGGGSNQKFVRGGIFPTETFPVTLELRIRGLSKGVWEEELTEEVPYKPKKPMIKFCSNCGTRRRRRADHFCPRCSTAYHPRYEKERGKRNARIMKNMP